MIARTPRPFRLRAVLFDFDGTLTRPGALDFAALAGDDVRTLVIFRDVKSAVDARAHGLPDGMLNLGNVHAGPGRVSISRSVFLDDRDARELATLSNGGMDVRVQAVPTDAPARYPG